MLPNFVMFGSQKCGSTTLAKYLMVHPEIFVPERKEMYFFCRKNRKKIEWYKSYYTEAHQYKMLGDCTVNYTTVDSKHLANPEEIKECLGDVKLIYIIRNPISRIESSYLQAVRTGQFIDIPRDFNVAIKSKNPTLIETTRYWHHFNKYNSFFTKILVVFYEDLVENPLAVAQQCYEFLSVNYNFIPEQLNIHANKTYQEGIKADTPLIGKLRTIKSFSTIRNSLPQPVRKILSNSLKKNLERPRWEKKSIEIVYESLYEDSLKMLEYCDKSSDFWDWNSYLRLD